ncbi:MAG: hypothetical protein QF660_00970 [Anaerolineales bacterium]|nr:hypothetical protein [Anaerolineales bacterium]
MPIKVAHKVDEGGHHIATMVASAELDIMIKLPLGHAAYDDSRAMRAKSLQARSLQQYYA